MGADDREAYLDQESTSEAISGDSGLSLDVQFDIAHSGGDYPETHGDWYVRFDLSKNQDKDSDKFVW